MGGAAREGTPRVCVCVGGLLREIWSQTLGKMSALRQACWCLLRLLQSLQSNTMGTPFAVEVSGPSPLFSLNSSWTMPLQDMAHA